MNRTATHSFVVRKYFKYKRVETMLAYISKRCFCNELQRLNTETELLKIDVEDEINWTKEMSKIEGEDKSVLTETKYDLSDFSKFLSPTFNFAAYVNKSESLKNMVKLGVDLHKLEKKYGLPEAILKLDFERDMKKHLTFLNDYVEAKYLGLFLTKNPWIFNENLEDLQTRINYLESKNFSFPMIQRIVTTNPYWLNFNTTRIDKRLGHFQKDFKLTGDEVRALATKQSRLITYNLHHVKVNTFSLKEEMGFDEGQLKTMLLYKPRLWMINQLSLIGRFNYVHSTMKIPHELICKMPQVLFCRLFKLRQRHTFLEKLGRAQFDNTKPNYVSLLQLVEGTDAEFCFNIAKCPVSDYNLYLKSL